MKIGKAGSGCSQMNTYVILISASNVFQTKLYLNWKLLIVTWPWSHGLSHWPHINLGDFYLKPVSPGKEEERWEKIRKQGYESPIVC